MGFVAADIADWFEAKRKSRVHDLEEWVTDNPQWWAVGLATAGATSMEFLGGYVDLLRLGEGSAEGGLSGYGSDALRLVSILPVGKLVRMGGMASRSLLMTRSLRLAARVKGVSGPCTFQAVNNAMQIARGKSLFMTICEMARALGKPISKLVVNQEGRIVLAAWVDDLVAVIRSAGGRVKVVQGLSTIESVVQVAATEGSPVIFAIRTTVKTAEGKEKTILHSVIAVRDFVGGVKFADYGGKLFTSLDQLVARWGTRIAPIELASKTKGASAVVVGGTVEALGEFARYLQQGAAIVLPGLSAIETGEDGIDVAFPATVAAMSAPAQDDAASAVVVKESFDNFARRKAGEAPSTFKVSQAQAAPRADWLTGVQFRLNHLGFGAGKVDGVNGPKTQRAVRAFQKANAPLAVDGIPGPKTQARLVEVCRY